MTDDRGQKTDNRGQKTEQKGQRLFEFGSRTRRRPKGQHYAAAKDVEVGKIKREGKKSRGRCCDWLLVCVPKPRVKLQKVMLLLFLVNPSVAKNSVP